MSRTPSHGHVAGAAVRHPAAARPARAPRPRAPASASLIPATLPALGRPRSLCRTTTRPLGARPTDRRRPAGWRPPGRRRVPSLRPLPPLRWAILVRFAHVPRPCSRGRQAAPTSPRGRTPSRPRSRGAWRKSVFPRSPFCARARGGGRVGRPRTGTRTCGRRPRRDGWTRSTRRAPRSRNGASDRAHAPRRARAGSPRRPHRAANGRRRADAARGRKATTFRHLLTHTSGLPTSGTSTSRRGTARCRPSEDATSRLVAATPPERQTVYSNVAFAVVGRLAGDDRPAAVRRRGSRRGAPAPLGMTSTTFSPSAHALERMALPYARSSDGVAPCPAGAVEGDVYTTAEDLARFLAMVPQRRTARGDADPLRGERRGDAPAGVSSATAGPRGWPRVHRRRVGGAPDYLAPGPRVVMTAQILGDLDAAKVGLVLLCNLSEGNRARRVPRGWPRRSCAARRGRR